MADKIVILIFPDTEGKNKQEYPMSIAKAEKMLNCRTTSKKWAFKDEKIKFVKTEDDKGVETGKIVFPKA